MTSHLDAVGWAPPGKAWLVAYTTLNQMPGATKQGNPLDIDYTNVTHLTATATLDGTPATKVLPGAMSAAQTLTTIAPVAARSKLSRLTLNTAWDAGIQMPPAPDGMPDSVHVTAPATITAPTNAADTTISNTTEGATP